MNADTWLSESLDDTDRIARDIASRLHAGDVVALHGDLGAGKTTLTRSLVAALGGDPRQVSSPTFVLLNRYTTPGMPVFHLDAYRVSGEEELEAIGFSELLEQNGIVLVEWAERVAGLLPGSAWHLRLDTESPTARRIVLSRGNPT